MTQDHDGRGEREDSGFDGLVRRLQDLGNEAGTRPKDLLDDVDLRRRFDALGDGIDDLRMAIERRLRGEPATKPLDEMTVEELHHLAAEREIAGRSTMNKAELIDALRTG
ncbi:MAG: Rho termination factor N-terminal domain-containing protein [Phycisphaerales bacterium]|nr:Rho termination factor N-terminal domain-containing protein [Phycisphaerales bacterium]